MSSSLVRLLFLSAFLCNYFPYHWVFDFLSLAEVWFFCLFLTLSLELVKCSIAFRLISVDTREEWTNFDFLLSPPFSSMFLTYFYSFLRVSSSPTKNSFFSLTTHCISYHDLHFFFYMNLFDYSQLSPFPIKISFIPEVSKHKSMSFYPETNFILQSSHQALWSHPYILSSPQAFYW